MTATPASLHLRAAAGRIVGETLQRVPLRAALLVGSAARGDSDFYSDLDLILYVDELPSDKTLIELRTAVSGTEPRPRERTEHACGEEFELGGTRVELPFITVARIESHFDQVLDRVEEIDTPLQKVLMGVLEGLPLHGAELIEQWRGRLREYPESLRRAMIGRHWNFVPLWYHADAMADRDGELWRLEALLEASFNLLAVLAGLNRVYFSRFQLTRLRSLTGRMALSPPDLADRLESVFQMAPEQAAAELERLVEEIHALVSAELPDLDLTLRFPPGTRQRLWQMDEA
jgi:predicted nucleotidyltransferase